VITYNHEEYIAQTIEGVVMQKTNFPIELIIGEDCSTDKTREICIEYQQKYPEIIKLQLPEKNRGARCNFIEVLQAARGKYMAICEGDDYWTDPLKLQKQLDFLEEHEDVSMCFHNAKICRDKVVSFSNIMTKYGDSFPNFPKSCYVDVKTLVKEWVVPTASMVFRRKFVRYEENPLYGDQWIILTMAESGLIYYLSDTMSVYRILPTGMNINASKNLLPTAYKRMEHTKYIRKRFKQVPFMTISVILAMRYWTILSLEMKENRKFRFKYFLLSLLNDPMIVFKKIKRRILILKSKNNNES